MADGLLQGVMRLRKFSAIFLLLLSSFVAYGVNPSKSQLESIYDKAFSALNEARYDDALKALDAIDAKQPDLTESLNLRGVVYMRQEKYDKAETAFRKALSIEPRFWNASFNLAEIPFLQKNWGEARNRFTALMASDSSGMQHETSKLIQYKILLTFVLQGKGDTVDWILNKFEATKESPALYYSNAAIAFSKGNQKEASEWMEAAKKQFSEPLNKLYTESFYEVGWMKKPPGEARAALETTSPTERAARLKADARANYEKAERAFQQRDFEGALKSLDLAEEGAPNDAAALNLRGEVLMEQGKFEEAENAFRKSLASDPKFHEAQYNLARIPFKKGEYAKSRDRFEALYAETPGGEKNQAAQLIKFKIFMTLLLEGKDPEAQQLMDQFKFTGDTPALYYAQAAWEFKHGRTEQGNNWVTSARKIYSPALNLVFADTFYDLNWLEKADVGKPAPTSPLAQANATPATPESKPALRFGQTESAPEPDLEEAAPSLAAASAASSPVAVAAASVAPATTPVLASKSGSPPAATGVARATPVVSSATSAALGSEQASGEAQPVFAGMVDRMSNPRSLLVLALLLAGILLLAWLVVQYFRRNFASVPLYNPSEPLTEPSFSDDEPNAGEERRVSRDHLSSAPPKVSVDLVASEPSSSAAAKPSSAITSRGTLPGVDEPLSVPPNESRESLVTASSALPSKIVPPAAPEVVAEEKSPGPLRDQEEVSLPPALAAAKTEEPVAKTQEPSAMPGEPVEMPEELVVATEEPVAQGQPIPRLTTAFASEPVIPEIAQAEPKTDLILIEPDGPMAAPIVAREAIQSSIEEPSFAPKVISTDPNAFHLETPAMPEIDTASTLPAYHFEPSTSTEQIAETGQTQVQLTFFLEIASMQLGSNLKMASLHLKPISKVVFVRLAPAQDAQSPMDLKITFEMTKVEVSNGRMSSVRLAPSSQQAPTPSNRSALPVSTLEFIPGSGPATVQLTPTHQEQASVQLTAAFRIAAIDFDPLFEIAAVVLSSSSNKASMRLPGADMSSAENVPLYEIENVQLGANGELAVIRVAPGSQS